MKRSTETIESLRLQRRPLKESPSIASFVFALFLFLFLSPSANGAPFQDPDDAAIEELFPERPEGKEQGSKTPRAPQPPPKVARIHLKGTDNRSVLGEVIAEQEEYGYLLLKSDGGLAQITPDRVEKAELVDSALTVTPAAELGEKVVKLMPDGSKVICTEHFVICYNTTDAYARWNAELYEGLYRGFHRFWKSKGMELCEPRFPLVALIFGTKEEYVKFAGKEFKGADATFGYYNQKTNRLASYDLTGIEGMIPSGSRVPRTALVQQILSRPEGERTVATIIHEACHQIAYNCGLQVRLGASPVWLSEGIATFFESPDVMSRTGWAGVGKVNRHNQYVLAQYLPKRSSDSLTLLLTDDGRMKDGKTSTNAYAEAWGVTHFLIQSKPKEFVRYLKELQTIPVGVQPNSKDRVDLFRACFGDDIGKLDRDFVRYFQRLR